MDNSLNSSDDSFLTWEKLCEESYPKIGEIIDLTGDDDDIQDNSKSYAADDESSKNFEADFSASPVEILEESVEEYSTPLPGSCEFLKNKLDPNTAICNLNDTLEVVEYILAHGHAEDDDNEEELHQISTVTLETTNESAELLDSVQSVDEVFTEGIIEEAIADSPQSKCARNTGNLFKKKLFTIFYEFNFV
jgi:hypothetical protein